MAGDPLGGRADEATVLVGALDWYRAVAARKVDGMSTEVATQVMTPSGLSPLAIVAHLAWAERRWFRGRFAGDPAVHPMVDNEASFVLASGDTVDSVVAMYAAEIEHSRRVIAAAGSLDDVAAEHAPHVGEFSLRWVLVHMLEETARHVGHLDLMCEQLDGRVGD